MGGTSIVAFPGREAIGRLQESKLPENLQAISLKPLDENHGDDD
jgi:hypothetical protein